jgi:hypothetical protein
MDCHHDVREVLDKFQGQNNPANDAGESQRSPAKSLERCDPCGAYGRGDFRTRHARWESGRQWERRRSDSSSYNGSADGSNRFEHSEEQRIGLRVGSQRIYREI